VRNWEEYVRRHLTLPHLTPEREAHIVRDLAAQLEDFYRDALARGLTEPAAEAHACAQVRDWDRFAQDVWLADRPHARPRVARWSEQVEEAAYRKGRRWRVMADLLQDTRYAMRQLLKRPGFTLVAVLTLALGIGANSAIFSVVNGVLLRPLPYPQADALVRVHEIVPQHGRFAVAPRNFLDWREQAAVFEHIAAYNTTSATVVQTEGPERISGASVSWNIFDLLRTRSALGRSFTAEEDLPGKSNVVVLSHGMWQRRFGGDPGIVGRTVNLSGASMTIVGVMPAGFYFPSREAEYWTPIALNPSANNRGGHFLGVIARLKDGVSARMAAAEMETIAKRLAQQFPETNANESAEVIPLHENLVRNIRPALLTLLAAVGLVVLIACGNVANLLLVRASVRGKEIAIRTALGAGRGRLIRQMLVESCTLALTGGALGLLFAYAAIGPLQVLSAGSIPRVDDISIDARVLAFTLALSVVTGIAFGLVPAWQALRASLNEVLKEGGRTSVTSGGHWLRNTLVVAEVAISLVLLVGASLLLRSFSRLTSVDPGFRAENVLSFRVALPQNAYPDGPHRIAFFKNLVERLEGLPQVSSAAIVQTLPMRGSYVLRVTVQGRPAPPPGEEPSATYRTISPGYFEAMSIPLLRGRAFTERDIAGAPLVAMVDEAFVRRHFPNQDPMGQRIDIGNGSDGPAEIVGVVGNVHHNGLDATAEPTMYAPYPQDVFSVMWVVARTPGDPLQLAGPVRGVLRDLDPVLTAFTMAPLANVISESVAQPRFTMLLLSLFALVALFLAAVGLFGVLSYMVSQRIPEIGVRMALGAGRGDLLRMVVGHGMRLALAGVAIGVVGALALARTVSAMLFEVTPFDPASYAATAAVLLVTAALACYVPARRALRVDPIIALRYE